jgi:diacylglycerol kinase (ATP)
LNEATRIIANPNAAGGRAARVIPVLRHALDTAGMPYTLQLSERQGHAVDLARQAAIDEVHQVVVLGGDGTFHEVVNGLLSSGTSGRCSQRLALCPVGTGNDFHRMVRAPRAPRDIPALLRSGTPRSFEVGRVSWETGTAYFVNLLGVGVDVEVLRRRSRFHRLPGLLQYGAALLSATSRFRHVPLRIGLEGEGGSSTLDARALAALVTVGPSVAGGLILSPDARPDDGSLDLLLIEDLGLLGVVRHLPKVLRGTHGSVPQITMSQFRHGRIQSSTDDPLHFELDGELMTDTSPWLEIEVIPDCIQVLESPGAGPEEEPR